MKIIALVFLMAFELSVNQFVLDSTPVIISEYENDESPAVYRRLTLSSDSFFFHYSICECGTEKLTKGKWEIQNGYLHLNSFADSLYDIYPELYYVYGSESDSVDICFTDYFKQPVSASLLCFKNEDTFKQYKPSHIYLGKNGHVRLSKNIYYGFAIEYESYKNLDSGEVFGHYFNDKRINRINIVSDFNGSFDRQLFKESLGNIKYRITNNYLYSSDGIPSYRKIP